MMSSGDQQRSRPKSPGTPTSRDVFQLFEYLLASSHIRVDDQARPVVFDIVANGEDRIIESWAFDPTSRGSLFAKIAIGGGDPSVLHLRCALDVLVRLVTDPRFSLGEDDTASFDGRLEDLLPIADALEQGTTVLNIASRRGKK